MRHTSHSHARTAGIALAAVGSLLSLAACAGGSASSATSPATRAAAATFPAERTGGKVRPIFALTGLPAPSVGAAKRPVLAVKIDNVAGAFPQWGVNKADVVVEEVVEGGLTRLVAAFQSHEAAKVGPIRSARPVDADIERLWNGGLLAYSGAAPLEIKPSIDHGHALLVDATTDGGPFYRGSGYAAPHNLFASTSALRKSASYLAKSQHKKIGGPTRPLFSFGKPSGHTARQIGLVVSPVASSTWRYSPQTKRYLRWQDGSEDSFAGAGQATATNVVVMQVTLQQTSIVDDAGNHDPLDVILGKGKAWVFSHGLESTGTWTRKGDGNPMQLRTGKGSPMHVAPGVTWIELLPVGHTPLVSR